MMNRILYHFEALTDKGLKVIPLKENTKIPLCKGWVSNWDKNFVREKLKKFPQCNIGVLLGDIIDVEGDSHEANKILLDIIKDYPHPTYKSNKSIHHLFLNPIDNLNHYEWNKIEFRGHGHQSVLPPSRVYESSYKWLGNFKFPVPAMPEELLTFLNNKRGNSYKSKLKRNHLKVNCCNCKESFFMHIKRFDLELKAFRLLGLKWECHHCRAIDLRSICRHLRAGIISIPNFHKNQPHLQIESQS